MNTSLGLAGRIKSLTQLHETIQKESKATFPNKNEMRSPSKNCQLKGSQSFMSKFSKLKNEFSPRPSISSIILDNSDKLKLRYLQDHIEEKKHFFDLSSKSKIDSLRLNFQCRSPEKSVKSCLNLDFNMSPKNTRSFKSPFTFVQTPNSISSSKILKLKANENQESAINQYYSVPSLTKSECLKKEIIINLSKNNTSTNMIDRINQLKLHKFQEQDLRKKVNLPSKHHIF